MLRPSHAHRSFPPTERSISEARRFVRGALDEWGLKDLTDLAVLAVSELVTNAVVHAGTAVEVTLTWTPAGLRVAVQDSHPERALALAWTQPPDDSERGRGLLITSALAPRWGVDYTRTSKTVWLIFPVASATPTQAAGEEPDGAEAPSGGGDDDVARAGASGAGDAAHVGLRDEALNRLRVEDYLSLAVERARDWLPADATYLMLARDFDLEYEVRAVSGLDASVIGRRLDAASPGTPDARNPHRPVVVPDLAATPVPFLDGTGLASLVVVPVTVEGRVTGGLAAASQQADGFTDDQAALLQRIADSMAVAADRARLRSSERERRGWLAFLSEAGDLLAGSLDQRMTMAITGQIVVPRLAAWCAIYLHDERQVPALQQVWHRDERSNEPLRGLLAAAAPDEIAALDDPLVRCELFSTPLVARGQEIGTFVLGRDRGDPLVGEVRLVVESVTRRAALAIDNARAHGDLQSVGEALQDSLLPSSLPHIPGLDVGVVYQAAGEATTVGGDFYDLFGIGGGRWCFVVGDVCGTGAQAAAVTGLARHTIRALALAGFPVSDILERLNTAILEEGERSRFLTLVCGLVQPLSSGKVLVTLVCAGHPPPFLVSPDGTVSQLGRPQSLLGVVSDVGYAAEEIVLARGDLLVTVTDGVLERREGKRMLEEDGLAVALEEVAHLPAQAVAERIRRLVLDFAPTPQPDDMAILAMRFSG